MVRWDFILSISMVIVAMFLCSGVVSHYAGDVYWQTAKAGIGAGILHGMIAPVMLIYSLFSNFGIYEINNKGWFYDFGFILGFLLTWAVGKSTQEVAYYYNKRKEKKQEMKDIEKVAEKVVAKKFDEQEKSQEKQTKANTIVIENKKVKKPIKKLPKPEEITI